ncbi:hypothetical protein CANTEDRAFT_112416 [Yamadazyma tenuis ATCC 10573]|uniref:Uncharacterized protein n=1 Tax=Candida tenuis (strain ATCC 10573 / BCRC 21748 / CBS 615 / JCM 9827 / NBRC 10315 / NRRL Y-1498 / VKM Y-70) TaxID=590646 RepID=G3AX29_CANTC|nr:uncharacterized protein CANTEDRAFT_112416 [Yamadazyma tenuis ATCC 10573]EGV66676.1 hypothetical protein CANTEDRAFT_112416 [Yamadazyma tenuis ATCC 10573]
MIEENSFSHKRFQHLYAVDFIFVDVDTQTAGPVDQVHLEVLIEQVDRPVKNSIVDVIVTDTGAVQVADYVVPVVVFEVDPVIESGESQLTHLVDVVIQLITPPKDIVQCVCIDIIELDGGW